MKPTKEQRKQVVDWIEKYRPLLGLNSYSINVNYPTEDDTDSTGTPIARTQTTSEYLQAEMWIYPAFFKHTKTMQGKIILHELVHIIVAPLASLNYNRFITEEQHRQAHELVTSRFENIIYNLLDA